MTEVLTQIDEYYNDPLEFYTEIEVDGVTVRVPFIRQSERKAFKTCQMQWDWAWNSGFTPAMPKQDARWFGTGLHLTLAEWYIPGVKRGRDPHKTWEEFTSENYTKIATGPYFQPDEWVDAKELGHEILRNYRNHYGDDSDWEVIATEQRYRYKLRSLTGNGAIVGILVGTFDAVLRNRTTGQVWMIDHKTARERINTNHLVKDEQAGTYVAIATMVLRAQGKIGPDEVVRGIIYNFLRKAKRDTRPRNNRGVYCNKPVKADYIEQISRYLNNVLANSLSTATEIKVADMYLGSDLTKLKVDELAAIAADLKLEVYGAESKTQPAPLFVRQFVARNAFERERQIERIKEELLQMQAIREGNLPLTKSPGDHCAWCDFKDICDIDEQGGDVEGYARAAFRRRDPYADHREGAKNSKTSVTADSVAKSKVRAF